MKEGVLFLAGGGGFEGGEGDEDDHVLCQGSWKRVCRA